MKLEEILAQIQPYVLGWMGGFSGGETVLRRELVYLVPGALTPGAGSLRIYNQFNSTLTISMVMISVGTAGAVTVDVNVNGTTVFTNQAHRPQIAVGANTGETISIDAPSWGSGQYLTIDIDQAGGADLSVHVVCS